MKVYQFNLNDRLGRYFEPLPYAEEPTTQYFLVVHPNDVNGSVSKDLPDWLGDANCAGILYVKGVPNAGLSREEAKKIEDRSKDRVHFLSYAIGGRDDLVGSLQDRFSRFFHEVETRDKIDWRLIDEPWPESLLAIYFLAKALSTLNSDSAQRLMANREYWAPVWREAKKEFILRTSRDLNYEELDADNASEVLKEILGCLEVLS